MKIKRVLIIPLCKIALELAQQIEDYLEDDVEWIKSTDDVCIIFNANELQMYMIKGWLMHLQYEGHLPKPVKIY